MKAVIFAAGQSTRTHPLTLTRPKPLLPVANRPILAHQLEALTGLIDEVILVVGYRREMIEERFGGAYGSIDIRYVVQDEQRGTGHALLQCAPHLDGPFLAMNGDDIYAAEDLAALAARGPAVLVKSMDDPRLFGVIESDGGGQILRVVEKPDAPQSNLANIGAYKFTPAVFPVLETVEVSARGEIEVTSAVHALAQEGDFKVVKARGYWFAIGYPWDLLEANAHFLNAMAEQDLRGEVSPAAHLSGPVTVGHGSVVRPGAVIDGPVLIGENSTVGPNCWLRPGTTLGNGCRVGQGVEIKNSILMDGAAVPHLSYVGDSVIGANANLGCGTVTANFRHDGRNHKAMVKGQLVDTGRRKLGAILGDGVHTGINTSLYPGRMIGPGGSTLPGQVVREDIET